MDGPAEVQAISRDAESMRRRIVTELEATRAATEALSQHGPVVLALRGAPASRTDRTAGELHWVNAGHPPALVVDRRRRERVVELGPTGPLVSSVSAGWTVARGPAPTVCSRCCAGCPSGRRGRRWPSRRRRCDGSRSTYAATP